MPGLSAEAWRDEGEGATLGNWLFHCLKKAPPQQNPILEKVSIHRPMGDFDLDKEAVRKVADELGITEELIFDNDHKIGDAMGVDAWPTYFLLNPDGTVRRHARGNFGVKMIEQALIRLLGDAPAP